MRSEWKMAFAAAFAAGILINPARSAEAARSAMENWALFFLPAAFPFAAVMPYLTGREARKVYDRLMGKVTRKIFRLPGGCASAIISGLFAGSPAGAMAVSEIASSEHLTPGQAARLAGIACSVSPAYVISSMGALTLGSAEVGWKLEIAQILALLLTGLLFRNCWQGESPLLPQPSILTRSDPILSAVRAMLRACGTMMLFSVGISLMGKALRPLCLFIDLPSATVFASQNGIRPVWLAASLGFGGLCILFQCESHLRKAGVAWHRLLLQKTVSSLLCAAAFAALEEIRLPVRRKVSWEEMCLMLLSLMIPVTVRLLRGNREVSCSEQKMRINA